MPGVFLDYPGPAHQAVCRWELSLEEGIKLHRFASIFPEQFFTEAGRHREAVVATDQRMVIRRFRDDLAKGSLAETGRLTVRRIKREPVV